MFSDKEIILFEVNAETLFVIDFKVGTLKLGFPESNK
jgi:hypothetical protein